jgi:hypothetical protein
MKKIISLLFIVLFAMTAYVAQASAEDPVPAGKIPATTDEPNGDGRPPEPADPSGVLVYGHPAPSGACKSCQTAGIANLSSTSVMRRASPGAQQSPTTAPANEPANSGN